MTAAIPPLACSFCNHPGTVDVVGVPGGPAICLNCARVALEVIARRLAAEVR